MWRETDPDLEEGEGFQHFRTPTKTPTKGLDSPPHQDHDELSRADTFETTLSSPSTFDSADPMLFSPSKPQSLSFEHHVKSSKGRKGFGGDLLWGISKPVLSITILFLVAAGAAAYLLNGWLGLPALNEEIERLEMQVNHLSHEVTRLGYENDRYAALNVQLNNTVGELSNLTVSLNSSVVELESVSGSLNETNQALTEEVNELTSQNQNYAELNTNLNSTALYLTAEVESLKITLAHLVSENNALSNTTMALESIRDHLNNLTIEQNETLMELQATLDSFTEENDRLEDLNTDLVSILGFLNETSLGIDTSLSQITDFLSNQIVASEVLVLENLENTMRQRIGNWDCDYRDVFREQNYGVDFSAPITERNRVLDYVDGRVLSELCLNRDDFDSYLTFQFPEGLTSYRLFRGVVEYTSKALDFYFPEEDEIGLSTTAWSDAAYACKNLRTNFRWSESGN
eukprot:CAMPEP_0113609422 /NCGR_PEP_ID=MMETSP0017_2-20120614/4481_1 /TAXON_ID=2856 /ORGANISM="Cylindrotheca closterium" /LENGTH=458 /DNA_ID=CAMNT_0000518235 /DNA_START=107 /DNA_END=1483 /DNA_ORIENTATION=+ /assembly_acc=CAM_ASM_000147